MFSGSKWMHSIQTSRHAGFHACVLGSSNAQFSNEMREMSYFYHFAPPSLNYDFFDDLNPDFKISPLNIHIICDFFLTKVIAGRL